MVGNQESESRRLEHRRRELVRRYEKAVERVALFPNNVNERQVAELAADIAQLDRRLRAAG